MRNVNRKTNPTIWLVLSSLVILVLIAEIYMVRNLRATVAEMKVEIERLNK